MGLTDFIKLFLIPARRIEAAEEVHLKICICVKSPLLSSFLHTLTWRRLEMPFVLFPLWLGRLPDASPYCSVNNAIKRDLSTFLELPAEK